MRDGRAVQAGGLVPIAYSLDGSRRCCGWRSPRRSARALFLACMKTVPAAWAKARGSSRSYKIISKSSRLPPLLQGVEALAVAFDIAIRGHYVPAGAEDKTRGRRLRDVWGA